MLEPAIVGVDVVGVEKEALLYWKIGQNTATLHISRLKWQRMRHTPLEAGHWRGHFDAACKEIGKAGKDCEQQEPQCSSSSIQQDFLRVDRHIRSVMGRDAPCISRPRRAWRSSGGVLASRWTPTALLLSVAGGSSSVNSQKK